MKLTAPVFRLKREARTLARSKSITLSRALDAIAVREGFRSWSHLASAVRDQGPSVRLLSALEPGDMVILGARPGHGKTVLGLELLAEAAKAGRASVFFSSECSYRDVRMKLSASGYHDPKNWDRSGLGFPTTSAPRRLKRRWLMLCRAPLPSSIIFRSWISIALSHRSVFRSRS